MEKVTYDTGILSDDSRFTSGEWNQYKFIAVPARYFFKLWKNGVKDEESPLHNYIEYNLPAFRSEYRGGKW